MREIHVEPIKKKDIYLAGGLLPRQEVESAIDRVVGQVRCNMKYFGPKFPSSAAKDQTYGIIDNIEWTDGFWTGLLWLCYEYTGDGAFRQTGGAQCVVLLEPGGTTHRAGSPRSGFPLLPLLCGRIQADRLRDGRRRAGLLAADKLMERFREKGGFIQAWGELGARDNYRLIIDCLLNIPLLYWASRETGDDRYKNAAVRHYQTACNNVIRDDASAYHTFYFDPETGEPVKGVTRQGYSDDSAWARGQAWGVYGIPLNYSYTRDDSAFNLFEGMTNYFFNRLPEDDVCYWDLIFTDGDCQSRDSSAAAVAVCGIHEMLKYLPEVHPDKETYQYAMHRILRSLMEGYANPDIREGAPVLLHGVYSWHSGKGVDEGNIWGDYYYMEALMRF